MTATTATPRGARDRRPRDVAVPDGFDVRPFVSGIGANLAGPANVILQLSWPGVGYGVMESKVPDGSAMLHPVKRARTTFTYLAVAMLGDDDDRTAFRRAVNGQHAQVRSEPGAEVSYNAMDPELQLWVAACLYYGTVDMIERMHGPMADADADALYAFCARFGTTLQVTPEMWPADRAAFDVYWRAGLERVRVDAAVRDYLLRLTMMQNLPAVGRRAARFNLLMTTGFLPPELREAMGLPWNHDMQARFDRVLRRAGRLERRLPLAVRNFPLNLLLRDMRRRRAAGTRLV